MIGELRTGLVETREVDIFVVHHGRPLVRPRAERGSVGADDRATEPALDVFARFAAGSDAVDASPPSTSGTNPSDLGGAQASSINPSDTGGAPLEVSGATAVPVTTA